MKQNLILLAIVFVVGLSACTEDKYMDWKIINDQWFAKHKNDAKFSTASGLQYDTIFTAWKFDPRPNENSYVKIHYKEKLVDETVFMTDSNTWVNLSTAPAGFREGLLKMHIGAKYKFYIPAALGYNAAVVKPIIPINSISIFEVQLLEIINQ
jgi:FKBP-type peptidyl-prolyl cis-trans isomerase FklB